MLSLGQGFTLIQQKGMQQRRTEILAIKNGQDKKKILHQGHKVRVEESGQTIAHYRLIHKK